MKSFQERLPHLRAIRRAILEGEQENGYSIKYHDKKVSYTFRELDGHLIIEGNGRAVKIMETRNEEEAKKICYRRIGTYLIRNSHLQDAELCPLNTHYCSTAKDGMRIFALSFPMRFIEAASGRKTTKFGWLDKELQKRINIKRVRRGLEPALAEERI